MPSLLSSSCRIFNKRYGVATLLWLFMAGSSFPVMAQTAKKIQQKEQVAPTNSILNSDDNIVVPVVENTPKKKLEVEADRMNDDKKNNIIRAEGNVKVYYNDQILKSDFLILDRKKNKMWARGNVYFRTIDDTGKSSRTTVSQEMEMTGDFKSGVSQEMVGRIGQHGSITASESSWVGKQRIFKDISYTNCYLCSPLGDNTPLWRVRAARAVEDTENKELRLYNGWVELLNIPLFYTPYLSFPNGRGSGFLMPTFKYNTQNGLIIRPAVFVVFSDNSDLLFNPYITARQGLIGSAMFRQRFAYTDLNIGGIVLYDRPPSSISPNSQWQGYVYTDFRTTLNNEWQISGALRWASRQDFFQNYTFFSRPGNPGNDIISFIEATGFISPHYINYSYYYYQDNRKGNPFDKILVGPRAEWFGRGTKTTSGGQWRFDGDMRYYIEPKQGTSGLLHFDAGWKQPVYFLNGMVFNIDAGLRVDIIHSHFYQNYLFIPAINIPGRDKALDNIGGTQNYVTRFIPEILTTLSYPLIAQTKKNSLIIEPIFGAYFSFGGLINKNTNGGSNDGLVKNNIFDTDSSPLEINSDNLFLRDRTIGSSYYENYGRVAYGLKIANILKSGSEYKLFVGHGVNFFPNQNPYVPLDLQFNEASTNLILSASWIANKYFKVSDTILLDDKNFKIERQIARLDATYQNINLSLSYFYYRNDTRITSGELQQIVPAVFVKVGDNWRLQWRMIGDLSNNSYQTRSMEMGVVYSDECWYMSVVARRIFASYNVIDTGGWQFIFNWRIVNF